jgi:hypothetical protein
MVLLPIQAHQAGRPWHSGLGSPPMKGDQPVKGFPRNRVARIIREIPPWAPARRASLDEIEQRLEPLREIPLSAIRQGMEVYIAHSLSKERYDVEEMSRVFLVNRYVLAIPERIPATQNRAFGGWIMPSDESVTSIWPFPMWEGRLQLTGQFRGYFGAPYDALGEFDHFIGFGPRGTNGNEGANSRVSPQ